MKRHTLAEVAKEMGISRARAYQIEQSALRKAREILEARGYTLADLIPEDVYNEEGENRED